jgi:hypothetical protein
VQLLEAPDQESELGLKTGSSFAVIKGAEEGIIVCLHDALSVQVLGQYLRQRGLADSYRTFHCNVAGQLKKIGHGLARFEWQDIPAGSDTQLRNELTPELEVRM